MSDEAEYEIRVHAVEADRVGFVNGRWRWSVHRVFGKALPDSLGRGSALTRRGALRGARRFVRKARRVDARESHIEQVGP